MNNISGENPENTLGRLLKSLEHLYRDLADEYVKMSSKTIKNNIKKLLLEFAEEARQDSIKIREIMESKVSDFDISDEEISMLSHLAVEYKDLDDEEKLIFDALKLSDNLQSLYQIILKEYNDKTIKNTFEMLIKHENSRKNELRRLYEDIVVKGEW